MSGPQKCTGRTTTADGHTTYCTETATHRFVDVDDPEREGFTCKLHTRWLRPGFPPGSFQKLPELKRSTT